MVGLSYNGLVVAHIIVGLIRALHKTADQNLLVAAPSRGTELYTYVLLSPVSLLMRYLAARQVAMGLDVTAPALSKFHIHRDALPPVPTGTSFTNQGFLFAVSGAVSSAWLDAWPGCGLACCKRHHSRVLIICVRPTYHDYQPSVARPSTKATKGGSERVSSACQKGMQYFPSLSRGETYWLRRSGKPRAYSACTPARFQLYLHPLHFLPPSTTIGPTRIEACAAFAMCAFQGQADNHCGVTSEAVHMFTAKTIPPLHHYECRDNACTERMHPPLVQQERAAVAADTRRVLG